jgi:ribosomal protein L11 methyltransferase
MRERRGTTVNDHVDGGGGMAFLALPMTTTATLTLPESDAVGMMAALADDPVLGEYTIDASEVAPGRWEVLVYFPDKPDKAERAALARHGRFAISDLPETDWVAKSLEGLKPVRAGRFLVHGRHDRDQVKPNDLGLEIEAGQAFGTGHHGTTTGCLMVIEREAKTRPILNALDVGTGSGVLAIALARLAKARVLASDIDPVATMVADENVRLNGVAAFVRCITAAGLASRVFACRAPYDLIVANILAGPLAALAPAIRRAIAPDGTVILSGLLPAQRARIVATYRGTGLLLVRSLVVDGWLTLVLRRPTKRKHASVRSRQGGNPGEARN